MSISVHIACIIALLLQVAHAVVVLDQNATDAIMGTRDVTHGLFWQVCMTKSTPHASLIVPNTKLHPLYLSRDLFIHI